MFFKKNKESGLTAEIRVKRCYGCGAILQSQDPNEVGYVPPEKFASDDETLCERCYKLRHYSQYKETKDINIDYITILDNAKEENALAVYVFNAFSLNGSLLDGLGQYLPKKVLVVINKRDLLPRSYSDEYLIAQTKALLKSQNIEPLDILVTSASSSKTANIPSLLEDINKYRDGKDVYFIGAYQVGKSSIINSLLMAYKNETNRVITTSPYPGTTLDVISIPLDENSNMYDTPGIYNSKSIISKLEGKIIKYVLPRNEVRPESYAAKDGQSFLFSNLARFDFVKGEKTTFTFYKSNDLSLQRAKINKADELFTQLAGNDSLETRSERFQSIKALSKTSLKALKGVQNRVRIYGLGFIEFNGSDQEIDVYAPEGISVTIEEVSVKL
jgi:30S ribosome assembly GTPase